MNQFQPGDSVVHLVTGEEGIVKSLHILRIGTNAAECLLVIIGKEDKVWLSHETTTLATAEALEPPHHPHRDVPPVLDPGNPIKTLGEIVPDLLDPPSKNP